MLLGYSAGRFSGSSFFGHLLPFTAGVLVSIVAAALFLLGWWKLRQWLRRYSDFFPPALSISLAFLIAWLVTHDQFTLAYGNFRTLVGGKEEAGRVTISHQVYAAYRRHDAAQLQKMVNRSQEYRQAIEDAARSFGIDVHLLHGIAATESSFIPRDSHDGGRGLFQITRVPETVIAQARRRLNVEKIVLDDPRHNAFVAAATFKHYLAEMKDDLFLGLLAYKSSRRTAAYASSCSNTAPPISPRSSRICKRCRATTRSGYSPTRWHSACGSRKAVCSRTKKATTPCASSASAYRDCVPVCDPNGSIPVSRAAI